VRLSTRRIAVPTATAFARGIRRACAVLGDHVTQEQVLVF
jgi:hypothetical protein